MNSTLLSPPQQLRSRRTLERIVAASLAILDTHGPSALTVQAVVQKANSSVGSFYARFRGKADLLDYLGERVWTEALDRWNEALASRDWSELDLPQLAEGAVGLLLDAQRSRSSYLRALDNAAGGRDDAYARFRTRLLTGLESLLLARRVDIEHPSPELAVRLGLRAVMGVVDAEDGSGDSPLPRETLVAQGADILVSYLAPFHGRGRRDGGQVDFFDVWG